jgi:hypothetical protein
MTIQQRGLIFIGLLLITMLLIFIITSISDHKEMELSDRKYNEYVGKVQFKGKVIHSKIYQFGGRPYFIICVQLDYSNFKDYYVVNDYCFFKIKNNIATMTGGFFNTNYGIPKYVEVNIANSGNERFKHADGSFNDVGLSLANYGLTKDDMNVCN